MLILLHSTTPCFPGRNKNLLVQILSSLPFHLQMPSALELPQETIFLIWPTRDIHIICTFRAILSCSAICKSITSIPKLTDTIVTSFNTPCLHLCAHFSLTRNIFLGWTLKNPQSFHAKFPHSSAPGKNLFEPWDRFKLRVVDFPVFLATSIKPQEITYSVCPNNKNCLIFGMHKRSWRFIISSSSSLVKKREELCQKLIKSHVHVTYMNSSSVSFKKVSLTVTMRPTDDIRTCLSFRPISQRQNKQISCKQIVNMFLAALCWLLQFLAAL